MDWKQKAQEKLLPLSKEMGNLDEALKEWAYTGEAKDHGTPSKTCKLCDNTGLRYHFRIKNKNTGKTLQVGSSCILRFDIAVYSKHGKLLKGRDKKKKLNDKIKELKLEAALTPLRKLWKQDHKHRESVSYYADILKEHDGITPDQLLFLFRKLIKNGLDYEPPFYKVLLRSSGSKYSLFHMPEEDKKLILQALSSNQKKKYSIWEMETLEEINQKEQERKDMELAILLLENDLVEEQDNDEFLPEEGNQYRINYDESFSTDVNKKENGNIFEKEAACIICGQITNDWWCHDNATNTCKCNDCKKMGITDIIEE